MDPVAVLAGWPRRRRRPQVTGLLPRIGELAGVGAGVLGPAMCTYTAVLLADTATPSWHEAHGTLPVLFAGSALTSGAGAALLARPAGEVGPAVRAGLLGARSRNSWREHHLETGLGLVSEPYRTGRAGKLLKAAKALTAAGAGLVPGRRRRNRAAGVLAGAAYLASGLCTRFGVYAAGVESTKDPKYVVIPQRERLTAQR